MSPENGSIFNYTEKYFKMKKSECKDSLDIYKKFLTRVTKIAEFMKIAEVRPEAEIFSSQVFG